MKTISSSSLSLVRKAVIPVAGLGTRFLPATKAVPKELLPIVDRPAIHYLVEELVEAGVVEIILVTSRGKQGIVDYFDRDIELEAILRERQKWGLLSLVEKISEMASFVTVLQPKPLGLGHAVLCVEELIGDEPFLLCLPDDLILSETPCVTQLLQVYQRVSAPIVAVQKITDEQVSQYGVLKPDKIDDRTYRILDLIEKPSIDEAPSRLGVVGRYLLFPDIFEYLKEVSASVQNEIQLTDALRLSLKKQPVYGFEFDGTRYDIGDKLGFLKANLSYALKREEFREPLQQFLSTLF